MATRSTHIRINASKEQVWAVLSDFGGIYRWNPGVRNSFSTFYIKKGILATRRCELLPGDDYLYERVLEWVEGESFKVKIYDTNPLTEAP
ncbi:MAG: SRPBCC family protein [Chloroflexota bacterium]|nr:SRPBCC family protein [Chloroflexota bacterium]